MDKESCDCCESGHMISSFSPRAVCHLCHHEYKTVEGEPITLDADEVVRIIHGRETRIEKLIKRLKEAVAMWAMDLEYESQHGNTLYAAGMDRCASELKGITEWYLHDSWRE